MFVIKTQDGRYYNGRAGTWNDNLTKNATEAFNYNTYDNAYRKAELFNRGSNILHPFVFTVEEN